MKSIVAFAAIFASLSAAAPWYTIHTTSYELAQLVLPVADIFVRNIAKYNNLYLRYKNNRVGAIRGTRESASRAQKFYAELYPPTKTISFITQDNHALALRIMQAGIHAVVDLGT